MGLPRFSIGKRISRRHFLAAGVFAAGGVGVYAAGIERHWIETTRRDVFLPGLPQAFDGFRIVQLTDIHFDEYTEPFLLRQAVAQINRMNPDAVLLTGDFITFGFWPRRYFPVHARQCGEILSHLNCTRRYAVLGNHDMLVGKRKIIDALTPTGITVLDNAYLPIEQAGSRIWIAGLEDPVMGKPDLDAAIPGSIRNLPQEPVILMCHAPDYIDELISQPAGQAVSFMLSGHTHGGQVRLPLIGPIVLPELGRRYVEGWFRVGEMQLYVNRGLGSMGLPIRFNCPPEIALFTLRSA